MLITKINSETNKKCQESLNLRNNNIIIGIKFILRSYTLIKKPQNPDLKAENLLNS